MAGTATDMRGVRVSKRVTNSIPTLRAAASGGSGFFLSNVPVAEREAMSGGVGVGGDSLVRLQGQTTCGGVANADTFPLILK